MCPLGMWRPLVAYLRSHGADGSLRCCGVSHLRLPSLESTLNLQSTFSPPQRWSSRRSRGQQPETSPTSSTTTSNCCTTQGQCSQLYFSLERKSYLTFSPCDSLGRNLDQFYNRIIVKHLIPLSTLSPIVKVVSIASHTLPSPDLTQIVAFPNTIAHCCSI